MPKEINQKKSESMKKIVQTSRWRKAHENQWERMRSGKSGSPAWKGGTSKIGSEGYIGIHLPEHPNSNKRGYVLEHRIVVENNIGRLLKSDEVVHHINGDVQDNRLENLKIYSTQSEHMRYHRLYKNKKQT